VIAKLDDYSFFANRVTGKDSRVSQSSSVFGDFWKGRKKLSWSSVIVLPTKRRTVVPVGHKPEKVLPIIKASHDVVSPTQTFDEQTGPKEALLKREMNRTRHNTPSVILFSLPSFSLQHNVLIQSNPSSSTAVET
jgi:hypothetical protein